MSQFFERIVCTSLLTVGIFLAFDSQGIDLGTEGIIGLSCAASALAYLLLPDKT